MATFDLDGKSYTVIKDDDWFLKETREVELWVGAGGMAEGGIMTRYACLAAVSIARVDKGTTITGWLDSQTNRTVVSIYEQLEDQAKVEEAAKRAADEALVIEGVVLSPSSGGPETPPQPAEPSSMSSSTAGGSPL